MVRNATTTTAPSSRPAPCEGSASALSAPLAHPLECKILTVNMHKGFTTFNRRFMLHELREAVRAVGSDLVFLQEVSGSNKKHASRLANFPQVPHYEFLADSLWPQYAYGRNAVYDNGDHGNALLSRYPITHYENHNISISGPEKRGMLHCVVQPPGHAHPIHAVCVHLSLQESHRQRQLKKVCDLLRSFPADEPVVLAGDFNDWRQRAGDVLRDQAGLTEVHRHANGQSERTFPAVMPMLQLDRIYVRNVARHQPLPLPRKPWDQLSDHAPLAASIALM